jgi:hypothetical protein
VLSFHCAPHKNEDSAMLGPIDIEDWTDGDKSYQLRSKLRQIPVFRHMSLVEKAVCVHADPEVTELARRMSQGDFLEDEEVECLAEVLMPSP